MGHAGVVKNGVIVLDDGASIAEGARVRVIVEEETRQTESLSHLLMRYAGTIDGLPEDMARNHDHYLHGLPKR